MGAVLQELDKLDYADDAEKQRQPHVVANRPGLQLPEQSYLVGQLRPSMADPDDAILTRLAADVASGRMRVPITATYPLEQAGQAFADFGYGALGKLAIALS